MLSLKKKERYYCFRYSVRYGPPAIDYKLFWDKLGRKAIFREVIINENVIDVIHVKNLKSSIKNAPNIF